MRTTAAEDLTTKARIRDCAIKLCGEKGFGVGIREIASCAGVSPGLVNHHYGSKVGMRQACDDHVLMVIRESKKASFDLAPAQLFAEFSDTVPVVAYIVRSLQAGGPLAVTLFTNMVDDAERTLRAAVAAGTVKPSADEAARAKFLTLQNLGAILLYQQLAEADLTDFAGTLAAFSVEAEQPSRELYAQGLMT